LPCSLLQVNHTNQEILNTLFEGLRRLEYRGYDSAGVSVDWPVQVRRPPPLALLLQSVPYALLRRKRCSAGRTTVQSLL
jgi:hypothetical protein